MAEFIMRIRTFKAPWVMFLELFAPTRAGRWLRRSVFAVDCYLTKADAGTDQSACFGWIHRDGDFVAGLELAPGPTLPGHHARAVHFHGPLLDAPALVLRIYKKLGMWIQPFELRDGARQCCWAIGIVRDTGSMMCINRYRSFRNANRHQECC